MLKKFWNWLVYSSTDPNRLAMTVRGALLGVLPVLVMLTGLAHLSVDSTQLTTAINDIALLIQYVLGAVSITVSIYGIIRKLATTFTGTNAVINNQ